MKEIAIWSPKGGVGKTTLTLHLAAYFASQNLRVGIVNLDPQGSAAIFADRDLVRVIDESKKSGADIVLYDCPPGADAPPKKIAIMPITLDPLSMSPSKKALKFARAEGHQIFVVANNYDARRSEQKSALDLLGADFVVHARSIYPRLIGRKKTAFDESGLLSKFYGGLAAKEEMTNFGLAVTTFLGKN